MFRRDEGNKEPTLFEALGVITFLVVTLYAGGCLMGLFFKFLLWIDSLF
jgi:hypothetical protein